MKRNPRFAAGAQSRLPGFNESGSSKPGITLASSSSGGWRIEIAGRWRAGREKTDLFLTKLSLLLTNKLGDRDAAVHAIETALKDLG